MKVLNREMATLKAKKLIGVSSDNSDNLISFDNLKRHKVEEKDVNVQGWVKELGVTWFNKRLEIYKPNGQLLEHIYFIEE